jgi:hypothetical protein
VGNSRRCVEKAELPEWLLLQEFAGAARWKQQNQRKTSQNDNQTGSSFYHRLPFPSGLLAFCVELAKLYFKLGCLLAANLSFGNKDVDFDTELVYLHGSYLIYTRCSCLQLFMKAMKAADICLIFLL